jgi:hypothetical protein
VFGKGDALSRLQYFQYLRPREEHAALNSFCQRLFRGEIRDSWIDSEIRCLRPRFRLIKEIRATLFLGWLHEQFPDVQMMLLFRHHCAVVASRVSLDWATDGDLDSFFAQPALRERIPMEELQRIRTEGSDVEKHAAIWCVSYLVRLRWFAVGGCVPAPEVKT